MILKTTAATIYISPFVDIRNGTLEAPSATEIHMGRFNEYKLEGGYDEQWTGKSDDLTINAPNCSILCQCDHLVRRQASEDRECRI